MIALLRRNFGYKLVSVLIASLLYFIANNQQNPRTSTEVYILPEVVGLSDDAVVQTRPAGFTATVAGSSSIVNAFKLQSVKATVDVSGARIGVNKLPISYKIPPTGDIDINGGPPYAEVTLDRKGRHEWYVDVINPNDPPSGFEFVEPVRIKAKVTGLPAEVARVARVVAMIPKSTGVGEIDETVTLIPQTESQQTVDTVQVEPARAEIRIPVKPASSSKILILSAQLRGQPAPGYFVYGYSFSPPVVTVVGSRENLAPLSSLTINVDVNGLMQSQNADVPIEIPAGLTLQQPQKSNVKLHIEVRRLPAPPATPTPAATQAPDTTPAVPTPAESPTPAPAPLGHVNGGPA